ncbi:hypothetical protein [Kitasatospora sp. NPDC058046]|uniref:hypothetical protein n=1 Tax=Kitasatospora sp. NPDC058046 TaxID=3346312 RepID=UPI0036D780CA
MSSTDHEVRLTVKQLADGMRHVATANPFVATAARGELTRPDIEALVRLEAATLENVTTCLDLAAARFRNTPGASYLRDLAGTVAVDQAGIRAGAAALGITPEEYPGQQLQSIGYGYASFINWLALHATPAAFALVAHTDLLLWHDACVVLTPALRAHQNLPMEVIAYFASYEKPPEDVLEQSVQLVVHEVDTGADLGQAADTARLMHDHLASFWLSLGR